MWNEPSWLDERMTPIVAPIDVAARLAAMREGDEPDDLTGALTPPAIEPESDDAVLEVADFADLSDRTDDRVEPVEGEQPAAEGDDWIDRLDTARSPGPGIRSAGGSRPAAPRCHPSRSTASS